MAMLGIDWNSLPQSVFISHAYADEETVASLVATLNERAPHVRPEVFPRQEPDPDAAVSNGIVERILACDGLIYLERGASADSLWVNFERDYARRTGRHVFAYDPGAKGLRLDEGRPVPLNVTVMMSPNTAALGRSLLDWLAEERRFQLSRRSTVVKMKEIPDMLASVLFEGAVTLWLLDERLGATAHLSFDLEDEMLEDDLDWRVSHRGGGRYEYDLSDYPSWLLRHSMFARVDPSFTLSTSDDPDVQAFITSEYFIERQFALGWGVDLISTAQGDRFDWTRADDLIVRLTLMLQRARPFLHEIDDDLDD
ncbi:MAG: hypothetical protein AAF184_13125 [Pseudomonadota bacterium]